MADPIEHNSDEDQYADDDFEDSVSDFGDGLVSQYESDEEANTDSDLSGAESKYLEDHKPIYNAPIMKEQSYHYESSSDEENDVVIGETVAEINTMAMNFSDAASDFDEKSIKTYTGTETETYTDRTKLPSLKLPNWDEGSHDYNMENNNNLEDSIETGKNLDTFKRSERVERSDLKNENERNWEKANADVAKLIIDSDNEEVKSRDEFEYRSPDEGDYRSHDEEDYQSHDEEDYRSQDENGYEGQDNDDDSEDEDEDEFENENEVETIGQREYRKLKFMEQDSQSELTNTSLYDSRITDYPEIMKAESENRPSKIDYQLDEDNYNDQHVEDKYEEDFEESDQNQNDVIDDAASTRLAGGINIDMLMQKKNFESKKTGKRNMDERNLAESASESTDNSRITSILTKALHTNSNTSVESIESMIQVLSLIKDNLNNQNAEANVSSTTSKSTKQNISKVQSDTKILQSTKMHSRSDTTAQTRSLSKIPCLIPVYRKPYSPEEANQTMDDEADADADKIDSQRSNKRELVSDYDSASISSSKSSKHGKINVKKVVSKVETCEKPKGLKKMIAVSDYDSCSTSSSKVNYRVQSQTPSSFNSQQHVMHMDIMKPSSMQLLNKSKGTNRKNFSFSNERLREIERHNFILLKKIESQKAAYTPAKTTKHAPSPASAARISSAAVNRKKQQRQIDLDNLCLKRKLEAIHFRRTRK